MLARGLLEGADLQPTFDAIEAAVDRQIQQFIAAGKLDRDFSEEPIATRWQSAVAAVREAQDRRSWDLDVVTPGLHQLMSHPRVLDRLEPFLGSEIEASGGIAVRPKVPQDQRTTVLWHQDSNYFGPDTAEMKMVTVWLPFVSTTVENGCMQVIPGSNGTGYHPAEMDEELRLLRPLKDPTRLGDPLSVEMEAGDALMFTNLTYHRSLMNTSATTRWSIDLRYLAVGTEFDRKTDFMPGFVARSADATQVQDWDSWWRSITAHPYYARMAGLGRVAA